MLLKYCRFDDSRGFEAVAGAFSQTFCQIEWWLLARAIFDFEAMFALGRFDALNDF